MTNINCAENCVYQKNGKCQLTHISIVSDVSSSKCAYFQEREKTQGNSNTK